jgi:ribonuclease T2
VLPNDINTYDYKASQNSRDWINKDIQTDSFALAISWSPQFCDSQNNPPAHQCGGANSGKFGFVVHGLWGQSDLAQGNHKKHPRNCRDAASIKVETLKEHLCMMPGVKLIQKEWEKHGTCDFDSPEAYLDKTQELYAALNIPTIDQTKQVEYMSWREISDWFTKHNSHLNMKQEHIYVKMKDRRLQEILVCYDLDYNLTSCN